MSDGLGVSGGGHRGSVGDDVEVDAGKGGVGCAQVADQRCVIFVGARGRNGGQAVDAGAGIRYEEGVKESGGVLVEVVGTATGSDDSRLRLLSRCGGGSAEDVESAVGGFLAGIDVDVKLRLGLFQRRQGKQGCGDYKDAKGQTFTVCGGGGTVLFS